MGRIEKQQGNESQENKNKNDKKDILIERG